MIENHLGQSRWLLDGPRRPASPPTVLQLELHVQRGALVRPIKGDSYPHLPPRLSGDRVLLACPCVDALLDLVTENVPTTARSSLRPLRESLFTSSLTPKRGRAGARSIPVELAGQCVPVASELVDRL